MAVSSLSQLPNEIILQILFHLPPASIPVIQRISKKFSKLPSPILWRYYCQMLYKHWRPQHKINDRFSEEISTVDWKKIFADRQRVDRKTSSILDSILSSQVDRAQKFDEIVEFGYDAKDILLRHLSVGNEAEDVLARRYHSKALLGALQRRIAIQEWERLRMGHKVPLERALASFDMFVLYDGESDYDDVSARLDALAEQFRAQNAEIESYTTRQIALHLVHFLRINKLMGAQSDAHYHDLQNNFIGLALQDPDHPSLPLVSVAIYCSVAQRLGLDAQPCGFPFHVLAIIRSDPGLTMDSRAVADDVEPTVMYVDPFRSSKEIPAKDLKAQLSAMGASPSFHGSYMDVSPTQDIVLRTGRNIVTSVQTAHRNELEHNGNTEDADVPLMPPELESAFYGALWASLLLGVPLNGEGAIAATAQRRQYLPYILRHFEIYFPTDISLIERYISPLFQNSGELARIEDIIGIIKASDTRAKQVKRRTLHENKHVRYKVGQVFNHKRYHYQAIIFGWDIECSAGEQWMAQMQVHELSRGRHQSFYHALVEDKGVRYVAEENIEIVTPELPSSLMPLAGKHFKRWDSDTRTFVSNIRDEYPDD